jgi:hypothetical protein
MLGTTGRARVATLGLPGLGRLLTRHVLAVFVAVGLILGLTATSSAMADATAVAGPALGYYEAGPPLSGYEELTGTVNANGSDIQECYFATGRTSSIYENNSYVRANCVTLPTSGGSTDQAVTGKLRFFGPGGAPAFYQLVVTYNCDPVAGSCHFAESGVNSFEWPTAPIVSEETITDPSSTSASLDATVTTEKLAMTYCQAEWESEPGGAFGEQPCDSFSAIASGSQPVTVPITNLTSNTKYHYWFYADNELGSPPHEGTFTTLASSAAKDSDGTSATATDGLLSATATGSSGSVTVGRYGSAFTGTGPLRGNGEFFDVYLSSGNSFNKLAFTVCGLQPLDTLEWDNAGSWQEVKRQKEVSPGCIEVEIEGPGDGTSPELAQMTGTVFAVVASNPSPAKALCTVDSGTVTLSPGLSNTPATQTAKIKGKLSGCTGEPFSAVRYTATLRTAGKVSCSVLNEAGEPATGAAKFNWAPTAKSSTGALGLVLTETSGVAFSGGLSSGTYSPLSLSGTISEHFAGGSKCGVAEGKKAAKAVKKGTLKGSEASFH